MPRPLLVDVRLDVGNRGHQSRGPALCGLHFCERAKRRLECRDISTCSGRGDGCLCGSRWAVATAIAKSRRTNLIASHPAS